MLWLQGLNFLIKPLWIFGVDRMAQIQLGDELYGKYFVIFNFCLMFNILLDLGLNNYLTTRISAEKETNVKQILAWRMVLSLFYIALIFVFTWGKSWAAPLIALAIANQVLASFVLFFRAILQGHRQFKRDAIVSVTDRSVSIIGGAIWIFFYGFRGFEGMIAFFSIQTFGYFIALLLGFFWSKKMPDAAPKRPYSQVWQSVQWFAILAFIMSIFTRVDSYMISELAPNTFSDAGVYAKSFRLLDAALIFSALLSTLLLPNFSKLISSKESTSQLALLGSKIILTVGYPLMLLAYFCAPQIMELLYHTGDNIQSNRTFIYIMASFLPMALVHIFGTYLTASQQLKTLSSFAIISMAINIILNYILIPKYGALGSAQVCLITQSTFASLCIAGSYINKAFVWRDFPILRFGLFLIAGIGVFSSVQQMAYPLYLDLFAAFLTAMIGFLLLFSSWKNITQLLKK